MIERVALKREPTNTETPRIISGRYVYTDEGLRVKIRYAENNRVGYVLAHSMMTSDIENAFRLRVR